MSLLIPPPVAPADTRTPTQRVIYENTIGLLKAIVQFGKPLWAAIWANPNLTPQQAIAELPDTSAAAFASYGALCGLVTSEVATIGADMSAIDPKLSGPIALPSVPAGWTYTAADGKNIVLTPPPATVPTGLAASLVNGRVTISWAPVVGGLYYSIQRSEDGGATFQEIAGENSPKESSNKSALTGGGLVVVTDASSWIDADPMPAGTKYQIAVTTPAGTSGYCAPVTL